MRCEVLGEQILFGNLQIEDKGTELWHTPALGRELLRPKNIYGMMIQQAVKHALQTGQKEILFQAGDAVQISQWRTANFSRIKVTPDNYAKVNMIYEETCRLLAAGPGVIFKKPNRYHVLEAVVRATPEILETRRVRPEQLSLLAVIPHLIDVKAHTSVGWRTSAAQIANLGREECRELFWAGASADLLHARLELLLIQLTGCTPIPAARTAQCAHLAALTNYFKTTPTLNLDQQFRAITEAYFSAWGYDKILLEYFPSLRKMVLRGERPTNFGNYFYYNQAARSDKRLYHVKNCRPPVLGKSYLVSKEASYDINLYKMRGPVQNAEIHNWYETEIPRQLKKYGLGYKKVSIYSRNLEDPQQAHAWKIISGLEEFAQRPLILF